MRPSYEQAFEILKKYNKEDFHIRHAEVVSGVMRYFAKEYDPENEEFWAVVGLLHDIDFELYPEEHCVKAVDILKENDIDEDIIHGVISHAYGICEGANTAPEHIMEKILFATDELTGLIGAVAIMRPSKSVSDLELKSVKKKFKTPKFAAGCSRDTIRQGAENLGWELDELMQRTIDAMKSLTDKMDI
ncbi:HD domain-containing protein [Peptacetobacter hominis]